MVRPILLFAIAVLAACTTGEGVGEHQLEIGGASLEVSTLLGGGGQDTARDAAFDADGNLYLAGGTDSAAFPTTVGAYDTTFNGNHDVWIAKLDPAGQLVWSTFLGGRNYDRAYAIEVDTEGYVYVGGRAGKQFPTTPGCLQPTFGGDLVPNGAYGMQDGFVAKIAPDGDSIVWSTYFGGNGPGSNRDIALDAERNVYVATTRSGTESFPHVTAGSFAPAPHGGTDGVLAKISADGSTLEWGGFLGGSLDDGGTPSVRVDGAGRVFFLGTAHSPDLGATAGAYQTTHGGGLDLLLARVSADGTTLQYQTYFGGSGTEFTETHGLALDPNGAAILAATTTSDDLPFAYPANHPAMQPDYGGTGGPGTGAQSNYSGDGFVAKLNAAGTRLVGFTYLGGSVGEGVEGVALGADGAIYVCGASYSDDFPVTADAIQAVNAGAADAFLAALSTDLSALRFGTLLGGPGEDFARSAAFSSGRAACAGMTSASGFPTTLGAYDETWNGGTHDAFAFVVDGIGP